MKALVLYFTLLFVLSSTLVFANPCDNGTSNIEEAYDYAKKAYYADNLGDLQDYIKKAKSYAEDAQSDFGDCNCSEAESASDDCYSYARKSLNSNDFNEAKEYARRAMRYAEDAENEVSNCNEIEEE
jgi:hypothetical protein